MSCDIPSSNKSLVQQLDFGQAMPNALEAILTAQKAKNENPKKPENITEEIREKEAEKIAFTNHISTFTMSVISPDKRVYPLHPPPYLDGP